MPKLKVNSDAFDATFDADNPISCMDAVVRDFIGALEALHKAVVLKTLTYLNAPPQPLGFALVEVETVDGKLWKQTVRLDTNDFNITTLHYWTERQLACMRPVREYLVTLTSEFKLTKFNATWM